MEKTTKKQSRDFNAKTLFAKAISAKASLVAMLLLGLVLVGCDDGSGDDKPATGVNLTASRYETALTEVGVLVCAFKFKYASRKFR
ncbi:hypothetical protein FACS1894102_6680 [Spirochaetia bacterium]|nr:hypothetical protein FACS1894102_6680 [Spirochaetia bacterium]